MNVDYTFSPNYEINRNPVLEHVMVDFDFELTEADLKELFPNNKSLLRTWGGSSTSNCHFISVNKGTPLHVDRGYKRYSHQLILYVKGFTTHGLDKVPTVLESKMYHVLDGHSPHKLDNNNLKDCKYVAVCIDSDTHLNKDEVIPKLLAFLKDNNPVSSFANYEKNL